MQILVLKHIKSQLLKIISKMDATLAMVTASMQAKVAMVLLEDAELARFKGALLNLNRKKIDLLQQIKDEDDEVRYLLLVNSLRQLKKDALL
jgi:hypothetical protein